MSSPVQDDQDRRAMYAPPWAREMEDRPPEAIIAAIERLRQERMRAGAAQSEKAHDEPSRQRSSDPDQQELPLPEAVDIETAMAETVRSAWRPSSLEPVKMPAPPPADGPTWGMVARFGSAVGFAALVALIATGTLPLPAIDIGFRLEQGAKAASTMAQVLGLTERPATSQIEVADASPPPPPVPAVAVAALAAPMPLAPSPPPPARQPPPKALSTEVLSAYASIDTAAPAPAPVQVAPKVESVAVPAAAPAAKLPEPRVLERDEIATLLKRGQSLLAEGDIASARLLLRRAAEAGDAAAAMALAGTYDRAELAKLKVIGVAADHGQARHWYDKAVELGSADAVRRLQQLAQRAD